MPQLCFLFSKLPAGGVIFGFSHAERSFDWLSESIMRASRQQILQDPASLLAPQSKGRACQGNSTCRWRLKRSAESTPPPPDPSLALTPLSVTPTPHAPSSRSSSWLLSAAVRPPLMTQSSCQKRASRQADWGRPFDEDPDTLQPHQLAGGLWTCSRPSTRALAFQHVL